MAAALYEVPPRTFAGVHFVLLGPDLDALQAVRSKLISGGGLDVGRYGSRCTHVIVDKVVYDHPVCVTARQDGKPVVTTLWVDHSFDIGGLAEDALIMYRPLRDLNGIPGAKDLVVCLTGYKAHLREDIMMMISMMGANLSKPLAVAKVTHLICYKHEGDKYELAKKFNTVKLVNHLWLEDCLKQWSIVPEANYAKSSYELEMMEAQAEDSEEEPPNSGAKRQPLREIASVSHPLLTKELLTKPNEVSSEKGTPSHSVVSASGNGSADNNHGCFQLQSMDKTPSPAMVRSDLASVSTGNKKSPKLSPSNRIGLTCSKTPGKATLPLESVGNNIARDMSTNLKSPLSENLFRPEDWEFGSFPEKRNTAISSGSSKLQRTDHTLDVTLERAVNENRAKQSAPESDTNELHGLPSHSPVNSSMKADVHLSPQKDTLVNPFNSVTPEANCSGKTSSMSSGRKRKITLDHNTEVTDVSTDRPESVLYDSTKPLHAEVPTPGTDVGSNEKPETAVGLDAPAGDGSSRSKTTRRKTLAKKTQGSKVSKKSLGSRPSFGRKKGANQKESPNINGKIFSESPPTSSNESKGTEDLERVDSGSKKTFSPTSGADMNKDTNLANSLRFGNKEISKATNVMEETESPENQEDYELEAVVNKKLSGDIDVLPSVDTRTGYEVGVENKQTDDQILVREEDMFISADENLITETGTPSKEMEQGELIVLKSTEVDNGVKSTEIEKNLSEGEKLGSSANGGRKKGLKNRLTADQVRAQKVKGDLLISAEENLVSEAGIPFKNMEPGESTVINSNEADKTIRVGKRCSSEIEIEKNSAGEAKMGSSTKVGQKKRVQKVLATSKAKAKKVKGLQTVAEGDKIENLMEMDKENRPVDIGKLSMKQKRQKVGKLTMNGKSQEKSVSSPGEERIDPAWFIVSGHKLQRKEFRQAITRLKGRVCRDSHQWNYQATHLIVPDPIRRTEKFFAAAASGSWILKPDYLAASNEAGMLVAEEPHEWYMKGLNEDGAINMEAPRKWRLLRERTGHGAFYGMRIVIYGECIAPPLDTLKRVVKAGDGTILATSPPYTRFLESGVVDFAIVSPGMPRVDIWVQEFLRHEIPCVVADYLVEYVCKPGYPLDRHVQYSTHSWATKSFSNLVNCGEDVTEVSTPPRNDASDAKCRLCGSGDNGEEMLICGDESGSRGCGIGAHIGCLNPPREMVPEGDWYCEKCSKVTGKKSRKTVPKSRSKPK